MIFIYTMGGITEKEEQVKSYLNILTLPLHISLLITVFLLLLTLRHISQKGALPFLLSLISIAVWTAGYIMEIGAGSLPLKLFWANIQFLGIGMLPVFWFITTLFFTGREENYRTLLPVLLPVPVLMNFLVWTDPWHHLVRVKPSLITVGPLLLIDADYGALHNWVFVPFQYIIYGLTLIMFLDAWTSAQRMYKSRYLLLGAGILIPMTGSALYIIGITPFENINLTSALFSVTCLIFARGIFNFSMLDIQPLARDTVVENLEDIILVFDDRDRMVDYNPAAENLLSRISTENIGRPADYILEEHPSLVLQLNGSGKSSESKLSLKDGDARKRHYRSSLSLVKDRKGLIVGKVLTISDITSQIKLLNKMEILATTDSLTGVLNRRSFFEQANTEIDRAKRYERPVSFILLDIDYFKRVNDSFGHAAGDAVLTELSRRITSAIRREDIFGRYGGEEFSLCLPETNQSTARIFAERLRTYIEKEPVVYNGQNISVTASFGVAGVDKISAETLEELLLHVDKALYDAKELGRNRCEVYSAQLFL